MKKPINPATERGAAIIVALFVTALIAAAAIAMIEHLRIDTRRTELILNNHQANFYAQGSIAWAMDQLITDWKQKQPGKVIDRTPIISPVNKVNGASISTIIYDAQGKLNLNNLIDPSFQIVFSRLIQVVAPDVDQETAQLIALGVTDWITPGINNSQFDQYYAKLNPPYRSAHQYMASISELRMVRGMTPTLYAKLAPFVTALPNPTHINMNSAPIPVIMSFSPLITLQNAKEFDTFRRKSPLASLDALANFPNIKNTPIAQSNLTVSSDFFLVKTNVTIGDQHLILYTLMMRFLKNTQPAVITVWQSQGTL